MLPLPGARVAIVFGEPLAVARDADREALESARRALERELERLDERAAAIAASR
jgi:hypothetical protein